MNQMNHNALPRAIALPALLAHVACGSVAPTADPQVDAGIPADAPFVDGASMPDATPLEASTCPPNQLECDGSCVDPRNDPHHCGDCSTTCAAGLVCGNSTCTVTCPTGQTDCAGSCSTLATDHGHCGSCDHACSQSEQCQAGACTTVCPSGQAACSGVCSSPATDPANCGACGHACFSGTCAHGACTACTGLALPQPPPSFISSSALGVGVADLDRNGLLDWAVGGEGVFVLLNQGGGRFLSTTLYTADYDTAFSVAEVTGDGNTDLIVGYPDYSYVLPGVGGGQFGPRIQVPGAHEIDVADLDGDGVNDMVLRHSGLAQVNVLVTTGSGTYSATVLTIGASVITAVALADLDGDGHVDIAAANTNGELNVVFGTGTGFKPAVVYDTLSSVDGLAAADLNGDGKADLVATGPATTVARVHLNAGNGAFPVHADYPIGIGPHSLHLGDLNRDGKVDIATSDQTEGNMSTLLNAGNGTFGPRNVTVTGAVSDFGLGDFDGDGVIDIAAPLPLNNGNQQPLSTTQVMTGRADGTFGSAAFIPTLAGGGVTDMVVGELSGDAKPDVVMAYTGGVAVLLNQGGGAFSRTEFATSPNAARLALADFGGNPALDIAVADVFTGLITFFINQGNGTFAAASPPTPSGGHAFGFVTADANGDGKPDLAFVNYLDNSLTVLLNDGNGGFSSRTYAAPGSPDRVLAGDLNGDGHVDLVVSSGSTAGVRVYTNSGDGTFGAPVLYAAGPAQAVTLADVTGDGKMDLLVAGSSGTSVGVLANTGAGFAALIGSGTTDNLPIGQTLGIGDLNGDGLPDAVNGGRGILVVLPNLGGAKFGAGVVYPASANASFAKVVDLDGDKRPDVLAVSDYGIDVFLNTRCTGP